MISNISLEEVCLLAKVQENGSRTEEKNQSWTVCTASSIIETSIFLATWMKSVRFQNENLFGEPTRQLTREAGMPESSRQLVLDMICG